ncbi:MAG: ATPase, partial [Duncaniella sp.]|nr:ATPase [Duncaniella sp.]
MKIIFDCGSTKTSVAIISSDSPTLHFDLANGYNALTGGNDELRALISSHPAMDSSRILARQIHYYGAGCATPQACHRVGTQRADIFPQADIHINSDMLGAARAVCGDTPGIVGILGTGSNSCLYDGKEITANVSPLGYILGDEGSGAVLGRRFLGMLLKNQFPDSLKQLFEARFHLDIPDIITRVYRSPRPNAFLASFAPFIAEHSHIPEVSTFLHDEFSRYVTYNLMNYRAFPELPVNLVGSIALHFR